ncbi:MAG: hypothetical protein Q4B65_00545 [Candidatus Saccharibacteria bacterium]|nr:hypothetical protein [Candidatus Saccharibacteria bacterium]
MSCLKESQKRPDFIKANDQNVNELGLPKTPRIIHMLSKLEGTNHGFSAFVGAISPYSFMTTEHIAEMILNTDTAGLTDVICTIRRIEDSITEHEETLANYLAKAELVKMATKADALKMQASIEAMQEHISTEKKMLAGLEKIILYGIMEWEPSTLMSTAKDERTVEKERNLAGDSYFDVSSYLVELGKEKEGDDPEGANE